MGLGMFDSTASLRQAHQGGRRRCITVHGNVDNRGFWDITKLAGSPSAFGRTVLPGPAG